MALHDMVTDQPPHLALRATLSPKGARAQIRVLTLDFRLSTFAPVAFPLAASID